MSVAKRLAGQRIARQMQPRIDALSTEPEDISESLKAHQRLLKEQFDIELRACRLLDSYFGAVVTELADTPNQTPDIKRYLKWARRERASALKRGDL